MHFKVINESTEQSPSLPFPEWAWLESHDFFEDFDGYSRNEYNRKELLLRSGTATYSEDEGAVPVQFVARQVIERYCMLTAWALTNIELDADELTIILNTTCGPYWQWHLGDSVAQMVADDNGISSLDELTESSTMRALLEKLLKLDMLENVALVDFCERFWRTPSTDFRETCARLGLELVE